MIRACSEIRLRAQSISLLDSTLQLLLHRIPRNSYLKTAAPSMTRIEKQVKRLISQNLFGSCLSLRKNSLRKDSTVLHKDKEKTQKELVNARLSLQARVLNLKKRLFASRAKLSFRPKRRNDIRVSNSQRVRAHSNNARVDEKETIDEANSSFPEAGTALYVLAGKQFLQNSQSQGKAKADPKVKSSGIDAPFLRQSCEVSEYVTSLPISGQAKDRSHSSSCIPWKESQNHRLIQYELRSCFPLRPN